MFIALFALPHDTLVFCALLLAALSPFAFFFKGYTRLRILIITLSLAFGFLWYFAHSSFIAISTNQLDGSTTHVTAVVTAYPVKTTRGESVDLTVRLNGYPDVGARLYFNSSSESLYPGRIITFSARFIATNSIENSGVSDALSSKGRFLTAYIVDDFSVIGKSDSPRFFPLRLSHAIADMVGRLFPADTSPFMQALLTGNRDLLFNDTAITSDLSVSGISHVVAVSGMHVSFLTGFLAAFIKRKQLFAIFAIPTLFIFMAMTGFSPSVTRAGIMSLFLITAPLVQRESDGITSLSAALFILLALNPYSAASVGLQLSFAAALGIILFSSKLDDLFSSAFCESKLYSYKSSRFFLRFFSSSLSATAGALALTTPLAALHFGMISLAAPITNLLTLWMVSLAFSGGFIAAILGSVFFPLGYAAAFPVSLAVRYILAVARFIASIPNAAVYVSNRYILFWLFYLYSLLIALAALRVKFRSFLSPVCLSIASLCAILLFSSNSSSHGDTRLTVLNVGQGQSIVITSGDKTAMIDCGGESGVNAGVVAHDYLMSRGYSEVDLLILTHFHADHANGVEYLLSRINTKALAIPDPDNSYLADDIIDLARRRGTDIIYITETLTAELGSAVLTLYPPLGSGDENERCVAILLSDPGLTALVTGDMDAAGERRLLRYTNLPDINLLIVGHHGSRHSTSTELLLAVTPDIAAISVGRNNYGHPADSILDRLYNHGIEVYRTDLYGSLTFGNLS